MSDWRQVPRLPHGRSITFASNIYLKPAAPDSWHRSVHELFEFIGLNSRIFFVVLTTT